MDETGSWLQSVAEIYHIQLMMLTVTRLLIVAMANSHSKGKGIVQSNVFTVFLDIDMTSR